MKTARNFIRVSQGADGDLNRGPPKYIKKFSYTITLRFSLFIGSRGFHKMCDLEYRISPRPILIPSPSLPWSWRLQFRTHTALLTSLLTPWSRVLLEKLTGLQLVKKFLAFYGNRMFVTALTNARHLFLSWA